MAERRMFKKTLIRSAGFMVLSRAAVLLYLYLCIEADDDGFVENAAAVQRSCRCSQKHLQELVDGGWVIPFESGVAAITHWHMHNKIPKDRYKPTDRQKERASLTLSKDGVYTFCMQDDNILYTQDRTGKDRLVQVSIDQDSGGQDREAEPVLSSGPPDAACDYAETDFDKILEYYQRICHDLIPCRELTPALKEKMAACGQAGYPPLHFVSTFLKANQSAFLQGQNRRGWRAGLDWLLEPLHIRDVDEGKYDTWT